MMIKNFLSDDLEVLQFSEWKADCNISHFVTMRHGGVSVGNYARMNAGLYTSDLPENIYKNRQILCDALHIKQRQLITAHQTHSDKIALINEEWLGQNEQERIRSLEGIDALITDVPEICVSVSTADCVPILIYAQDRCVVAAVHAGWRGTVSAILRKTVRIMMETYKCDSSYIQVAIGPSISLKSFEVGEEVVEIFRSSGTWPREDVESLFWIHPDTHKFHIDLWKANTLQLQYEGIAKSHILLSGICTYEHVDELFSARRLGINSGRILSGIMIKREKK